MTEQTSPQGSFIQNPQVLTDRQLGLEEKKLTKEFHERIVSHLFSGAFLVFILIAALVIAGIFLLWSARTFEQVSEYWKWVVPLITTYIGYAIGKRPSESGNT
ncbi:hypothetical protein Q7I15_10670 [Aeromonas veronii]|uniref:hypothetical protein n=1 Tax=Aeromonas veronii TaxID=654 RepID=UPI003007C256